MVPIPLDSAIQWLLNDHNNNKYPIEFNYKSWREESLHN